MSNLCYKTLMSFLSAEKEAEAGQKEEELVAAVGKLQGLLKESVERNEAQEKQFNEESGQLEAEINQRDEVIKRLSKELENANVLVAALEDQSMDSFKYRVFTLNAIN
jgi:hypothetical protein